MLRREPLISFDSTQEKLKVYEILNNFKYVLVAAPKIKST